MNENTHAEASYALGSFAYLTYAYDRDALPSSAGHELTSNASGAEESLWVGMASTAAAP
jgi:hypothetical protein